MTWYQPAALVAWYALLLFSPASAIDCYQCESTDHKDPFQCNEVLSSDISIEPQPCSNVYDASYCVKLTGRFAGGLGTKRYCSALDLGNYCNYNKLSGDTLLYRSCVYTCSSDGCNPAVKWAASTVLLLLATALALLL